MSDNSKISWARNLSSKLLIVPCKSDEFPIGGSSSFDAPKRNTPSVTERKAQEKELFPYPESFTTRRTSLAPIAAALATATSEYAERREEAEDIHMDLCSARLWSDPNLSGISAKSDAAVEAMCAAQEKVANLMADLQKTGALSGFYAFAAAQNRAAD